MPIRKRSMSLDESRLIVLAKEGDANAFAALLRQHQEMALRVAFQIVGDWDDAEDVCQESFVKMYWSGKYPTVDVALSDSDPYRD